MSFGDELVKAQQRVGAVLGRVVGDENELARAMHHAVLAGGKRLRAFLVYEGARLCQVEREAADCGAAAIELIHAYSLVHDDLPCMDDDDLRRGQPTLHVKWNEYTAVLAGDALQSLAFEVLTQADLPAERIVALIRSLSADSGRAGMGLGQFLDLQSENAGAPMSLAELQNLQRLKTGALISWSAKFGACAAGVDETPFAEYARHLGLAFQIWDDVLDVEASSEVLGKTAGKDEASGKATYVSLLGLDEAKSHAKAEVEAAKSAISVINGHENLCALADFVISREY